MANEQSGNPLRRWRPFYGAFVTIDDAIEAAGHPRAAFRDTRVRILELLRVATDDGVAEQLCAALDDAMAEALQTLAVAPVRHGANLARAVGGLGKHGSARIRDLAGDVMRRRRSAIVAARATTEIDKFPGDPIPCHGTSTVAVAEASVRRSVVLALPAEVHNMKLKAPPVKILPAAANEERKKELSVPPTKKPIIAQIEKLEAKKPVIAQGKKLEVKKPIVAQSEKIDAKKPIFTQSEKTESNKQPNITQSKKMETTKRKLFEGYEEAKRLKRQHLIQKINDKEAPKLLEQSQRKMHRAPARCRISSGVRRSLLPSLQLV